MSGRAGRRGLDPTGVVVIVSGDELPDVRRPLVANSAKANERWGRP